MCYQQGMVAGLPSTTAGSPRPPTHHRRAAAPPPAPQFAPTAKGFLSFMIESKVVYDTFEDIMQQGAVPYCE